jgi:hypothetical protein
MQSTLICAKGKARFRSTFSVLVCTITAPYAFRERRRRSTVSSTCVQKFTHYILLNGFYMWHCPRMPVLMLCSSFSGPPGVFTGVDLCRSHACNNGYCNLCNRTPVKVCTRILAKKYWAMDLLLASCEGYIMIKLTDENGGDYTGDTRDIKLQASFHLPLVSLCLCRLESKISFAQANISLGREGACWK